MSEAGGRESIGRAEESKGTVCKVIRGKLQEKEGLFVMNTKFNYLYRDASNYKKQNSVVVSGTDDSAEEKIRKALLDEENFIPRQVGLPEERFNSVTEDDHCWFELLYIEKTSAPPTIDLTIEQLIEQFNDIGPCGWRDDLYAIVVDQP